jgi:hypothetical protein
LFVSLCHIEFSIFFGGFMSTRFLKNIYYILMSSALRLAMEMSLQNKENLCSIKDGRMLALYHTSDAPCTKEYMLMKYCIDTNPVYLQTTVCMSDYLKYILCIRKHT